MRARAALPWAAAALSLVAACVGDDQAALPPRQPPGWRDTVRLPEAVDLDPAPDAVEIALDARVAPVEILPGVTSQLWTYDGSVPGPLIRAHAGDRLTVHFTNHLPEETTVHWHGIRLTSDMDGVPGHTQPPVPPGGSFDYSFTVPDASLFWYHPHLDSAVQVGDGLYGAILVEPRAAPAGNPPAEPPDLGEEVVLVLSDISLTPDGALGDPTGGGAVGTLFGREGDTLLVNGRVKPTLLARRGLRQRWRIVNTAKSRYYQLALAGHRFTRIGGDGGLIPAPVESDMVLVIPGTRADVLLTPQGPPGATLAVQWVAYDRGYGTAYNRPPIDLFYIALDAAPAAQSAPPLPAALRDIVPIDITGAATQTLSLTQGEADGQLVLGINGIPSWQAQPIYVHVGETDVWSITNTMDWDHPFHLHGFFFQPLDPDTGVPAAPPEWKDTINVPVMKTVQFAVRYDDRPGMWMFHCHILDHADAGMMGMLMLQ